MIKVKLDFLLILIFATALNAHKISNLSIIKGGGYSARLCLNKMDDYVNVRSTTGDQHLRNCSRLNKKCHPGYIYYCKIPCGYNPSTHVEFIYKINWKNKPLFEFSKLELNYKSGHNLTVNTQSEYSSLLDQDQIHFIFSHNISCSKKSIIKNSIICKLNVSLMKSDERVNVSIHYGLKCDQSQYLGDILVVNSFENKSFLIILVIIILFLLIIFVGGIILFFKIYETQKQKLNANQTKDQENIIHNIQKKSLMEYQNAVKSINNLGKLTSHHLLLFDDYVCRIFNIEMETNCSESEDEDFQPFKSLLFNQVDLIQWIDKMEATCRAQQRNQVASLLAYVLFQHPQYLLNLMKCFLRIVVLRMKDKSNEKLLFRSSDSIFEALVGNWMSLCMYENITNGEIGKKLFNLCRAIKCKMNTGLVDMYTKKAKYTLNVDYLMLGEMEYQTLEIKVNVNICLQMVDRSQTPFIIKENHIQVDVLSLDSITQVKEKILDKVLIMVAEKENLSSTNGLRCSPIEIPNSSGFNLFFVSATTKILLNDFDQTSIISATDKEFVIVNTMKHYSMKNGMKFLLISVNAADNIAKNYPGFEIPKDVVHLQMPTEYQFSSFEKKKSYSNISNNKLPINPIVPDINKENYFLHMLAVKKSLSPFIDEFFQCLTNNKRPDCLKTSTNSLFEDTTRSLSLHSLLKNSLSDINEVHVTQNLYLLPVYYLFSMLDEIGKSLSITDEKILNIWKSNSFILRFWVNIIKNPNFIFSVDKTELIDGSLTTVASVLMESCSMNSMSINIDSPIIKQMFMEDIKEKYSLWWQNFTTSSQSVNEEDVILYMSAIVEKHQMKNHYNSCLKGLQSLENATINP